MKYVRGCTDRVVLSFLTALIGFFSVPSSKAEVQSGQVLIADVSGHATYCTGSGGIWQPVKQGALLTRGAMIKTGADSTVDLVLQYNGTALRLTPNSMLSFDKLNKEVAGEEVITETSLHLVAGSMVGSQRKLASPSEFTINLPDGVATIKGTEYVVRADGAVSCLSGVVRINFNLPHNGGSIKATIPAGFSFDPATGKVVPTTAAFLQNLIADITAVRRNAEVFKTGGVTVVVRPLAVVSPTKGNNGVGNGVDPQPPGNPPINDGPGTGPGNPGNRGGVPHDTPPRTQTP